MLIGDKGQSGGRRWEVAGFALGAFLDSPNVSRWEVVRFPESGLFTSPKVRRWVEIFAPRPFFSSPKVSRWVWSRFAMGTFLDPSGQSLDVAFS